VSSGNSVSTISLVTIEYQEQFHTAGYQVHITWYQQVQLVLFQLVDDLVQHLLGPKLDWHQSQTLEDQAEGLSAHCYETCLHGCVPDGGDDVGDGPLDLLKASLHLQGGPCRALSHGVLFTTFAVGGPVHLFVADYICVQ